MMTRMAALACFILSSGAVACPMPPDATQLVSGSEDAPLAYAQMDTPPLSEPFAMTITFCDVGRQVEALTFDALMPAHRHGMNFHVDVDNASDNRFEVRNIVFHMPGLWEIKVEAEAFGQSYGYSAEVLLR